MLFNHTVDKYFTYVEKLTDSQLKNRKKEKELKTLDAWQSPA